MKHLHRFVRRAAAFVLAAALCVCVLAPAASAATTMGGADTTLIPAEEENCLAWLFGTSDTITMPYLNIKGKGLQRNVTLNLVDYFPSCDSPFLSFSSAFAYCNGCCNASVASALH